MYLSYLTDKGYLTDAFAVYSQAVLINQTELVSRFFGKPKSFKTFGTEKREKLSYDKINNFVCITHLINFFRYFKILGIGKMLQPPYKESNTVLKLIYPIDNDHKWIICLQIK